MPQQWLQGQKQMKNDTKLLKRGWLLLAVLALASCRSDKPPVITIICIGDGVGGADCVDSSGARVYKKPSELKNFWMTTQEDQKNFASWCYKVPPRLVSPAMDVIKEKAIGE